MADSAIDAFDRCIHLDPATATRIDGLDRIAASPSWVKCDFGPAALNRAWTLLNDGKDGDRQGILEAVSKDGGCHSCHSQGSCAKCCPNELSPMTSIACLKRASVGSFFGRARS
jgi:fumarate reductase iron-sulfur subunit